MPDTKPLTLFLLEDDEVDIMSIKRAFAAAKVKSSIFVAHDGLEALALMREGRIPEPRLILLDLNMPRMNGIDFLQELRRDPVLKSQVVFVLTTSEADEDKVAAYDLNVAGYMTKNDTTEKFLNVVAMLDSYWKVVEMPVEA